MSSVGYEDRDVPSSSAAVAPEQAQAQAQAQAGRAQAKACLNTLLCDRSSPLQWNVVNGLLQQLARTAIAPTSSNNNNDINFDNDTLTSAVSKQVSESIIYGSTEDDPAGRLVLGNLISRNPPPATLELALRAFPASLSRNPAAFFMACRHAPPRTVAHMMQHVLAAEAKCTNNNNNNDECPYPWILSNHISLDGAKALLEVCPEGVLKPSSFLSNYSPLDFFLMSDEMIKQRNFDITLWNKFKLMLVAAECCNKQQHHQRNGCCPDGISPVHTIMHRVLSRPDFLDNEKRAQHVLWLLHQLRWTDKWVFEKENSDGTLPLQYVLSHRCTDDRLGLIAARELVKILLEAHPISARQFVHGKLPLHMAIENGWPCHDLLLAAFPESLDATDPVTDLYPFQTAAKRGCVGAAAAGGGLTSLSLDVTYELLKANPTHATRSIGKAGTRVGA